MARVKLTKLKSVLKKWHSFITVSNVDDESSSSLLGPDLFPVFVGNTRRRYLVSSQVVGHPLFRELVDRSRESSSEKKELDEERMVIVACEVVLFEHLLWMLENADPQLELPSELVEFYACR